MNPAQTHNRMPKPPKTRRSWRLRLAWVLVAALTAGVLPAGLLTGTAFPGAGLLGGDLPGSGFRGAGLPGVASAQITPLPPPIDPDNPPANQLPGIKLDDARGRQLDLDLRFKNERGEDVTLGDYFEGGRFNDGKPVVVMLGYYGCPDLCGLVMNGMLKSFKALEGAGGFGGFKLGEDFLAVTVSIDPRETHDLAYDKQTRYAEQTTHPENVRQGWAMLVSEDPDSKASDRLARDLGFGYRYVKQSDRYGHAAAIYIASPDGVITRMMYGMDYKATDLKLSLVEAADGKVGSAFDYLILTCFRWDQSAGQYTPFAMGLLKLVAGVFLTMVGGVFALAFLTERNRKKRLAQTGPAPLSSATSLTADSVPGVISNAAPNAAPDAAPDPADDSLPDSTLDMTAAPTPAS